MNNDTSASDKGVILITGASAGIGREMAGVFAANGHDLVLVARRETELVSLARQLKRAHGIMATVLPADLTDEDAPAELLEELDERQLDVEVLVNNAGVLNGGAFRRMSEADIDAMLRLNIWSLTRMARLFAERMVTRGQGRIANVASIAAFQAVPSLAVYAATKAYVLSLSEALTEELKGHGVTVTAICPGFTDTDMLRNPNALPGKEVAVPSALVMQPDKVASEAYRAIMGGDAVKVTGLINSLTTTGSRLLPRGLVRSVSGMLARGGR